MKELYLFLLGIIFFNFVAHSQTLIVPTEYPTIEAALAVAQQGHVVQVNPGPVYQPVSRLVVPTGVTLKLQAGVTVNLHNGFTVKGNLETNGTSISKVHLNHLNFDNSMFVYSKVTFNHTVFAGGQTSETFVIAFMSDIAKDGSIFNSCEFVGGVVMTISLDELPTDPDELLYLAVNLMGLKNDVEALNIFKLIISNYRTNDPLNQPYYRVYCHALVAISGYCRAGDQEELLRYLKALTKDDENAPVDIKKFYASAIPDNYQAILEYEELLKIKSITTNQELYILNQILYICNYMINSGFYLVYSWETQQWIQNPEKEKEIEEIKLKKEETELRIKFINDGIVINDGLVANPGIYFGGVNIGEWKRENVSITNNGNNPYVILKVSIRGDGFTVLNNLTPETSITIQPGEKKDITVQFSPIAKSNYTANVVILPYMASMTEYSGVVIATLHGSGVDPSSPNTMDVDEIEDLPTEYSLLQNYPNPFNPTTTIQYTIPKDEYVKLVVYDVTGKVVKELVNGHKSAGRYNVEFNASGYASGIYYYRIDAGTYKSVQKMMLVK
jgi:hypothetical protein